MSSTLTLTHPATDEDWNKLLALNCAIHAQNEPQLFVRLYRERPDLSPEDHAMLVDEAGTLVATASLLPHHHYFGDTEVAVGELAFVGTLPERRLEGHAHRLIGHWLEVAQQRGYAYVYLYGIPRLYDAFGFSYAAPSHSFPVLHMTRKVLEPVLSPYRVRPLIASDIPVLQDLYDRANCRTPMAEVRSDEYWMYRLSRTLKGGFGWWVAVDVDNVPHGYVWADVEQARLREVVAADDEACRAILQWMKWELTERKLPAFSAQVPLDQTFAKYAYANGAMVANPHAAFPGNWAAMVRMMKFQPMVEGLKTQLQARLADSRYARDRFEATFVVTGNGEEEAVNIRWLDQKVIVGPGHLGHGIRMPATIWVPLLTGFRTIDDFPHVELLEHERNLLRALFKGGHPYIWDLEQNYD